MFTITDLSRTPSVGAQNGVLSEAESARIRAAMNRASPQIDQLLSDKDTSSVGKDFSIDMATAEALGKAIAVEAIGNTAAQLGIKSADDLMGQLSSVESAKSFADKALGTFSEQVGKSVAAAKDFVASQVMNDQKPDLQGKQQVDATIDAIGKNIQDKTAQAQQAVDKAFSTTTEQNNTNNNNTANTGATTSCNATDTQGGTCAAPAGNCSAEGGTCSGGTGSCGAEGGTCGGGDANGGPGGGK